MNKLGSFNTLQHATIVNTECWGSACTNNYIYWLPQQQQVLVLGAIRNYSGHTEGILNI